MIRKGYIAGTICHVTSDGDVEAIVSLLLPTLRELDVRPRGVVMLRLDEHAVRLALVDGSMAGLNDATIVTGYTTAELVEAGAVMGMPKLARLIALDAIDRADA